MATRPPPTRQPDSSITSVGAVFARTSRSRWTGTKSLHAARAEDRQIAARLTGRPR